MAGLALELFGGCVGIRHITDGEATLGEGNAIKSVIQMSVVHSQHGKLASLGKRTNFAKEG